MLSHCLDELVDGAVQGVHTVNVYDALGRLASSADSGPGASSSWQYAYDALGNLKRANDLSGPDGSVMTFDAAARDRVCHVDYGTGGTAGSACNVSYDGRGNVVRQATRSGIRRLTWFASGKVRSIQEGAAVTDFGYDAFGQLQDLNLSGAGAVDARHDRRYGAFIELRDQTNNGETTSVLSRRIPGPGQMTASRRGPGDWMLELGEQRGNRFFVDGAGHFAQEVRYHPYGEVRSFGAQPGGSQYSTVQWNVGDSIAAFGLSNIGARVYDPVIGRFLSRDPILVPRTAATTNDYAFAQNDPVNRSDPSGLDCMGVECQGPLGGETWNPGLDIVPVETNWPSAPQSPRANPQAASRTPPLSSYFDTPQTPELAGLTSKLEEDEPAYLPYVEGTKKGAEIAGDTMVFAERLSHGFETLHGVLRGAGYAFHGLALILDFVESFADREKGPGPFLRSSIETAVIVVGEWPAVPFVLMYEATRHDPTHLEIGLDRMRDDLDHLIARMEGREIYQTQEIIESFHEHFYGLCDPRLPFVDPIKPGDPFYDILEGVYGPNPTR
jgi:RHS repeat-associated protein